MNECERIPRREQCRRGFVRIGSDKFMDLRGDWMKKAYRGIVTCGVGILLLACWPCASLMAQSGNSELTVKVNSSDGSYALATPGVEGAVLTAGVAAKV